MIKYYTVKIFYLEGVFILRKDYEKEAVPRRRSRHAKGNVDKRNKSSRSNKANIENRNRRNNRADINNRSSKSNRAHIDIRDRRYSMEKDENDRAQSYVRGLTAENNKNGNKRKKIMTERRKRAIKRFNTLFIIAYLIFSIYRIVSYFSWRSLVLPMMKNEGSVVVDMNGNVMDVIGEERIRENISISDVPDNLKNAYIDIEDERFYSHNGVDTKRTVAAIGTYVLHGGKSSFGGSTITQQLVKNITGNDDTSISRKMGEWIKARELESFSSKDEILESYFNIIYLAPNVYGVNMGAKYYFNKDVKDLKLSECAFLAGINVSPNSYNPFGETDNSEKIKKRTKIVLDKMLELKHISQDEYNTAIKEVEEGLPFSKGDLNSENDGVYSYYTDAVISDVITDVAKKKHISEKFATNYVYMSGATIYSTEDPNIQEKLENEYNKSQYILTSSSGQKSQSAMVIMDHSNGQVKAVVGGLGEKTTSRGFNRATQAVRQTGSSIKPIAVLAPGIDKKIFTASTMYVDEPTTFKDGDGSYSPKDNDDYIGNITVRRAVESSQNIPFVKMMEQVTPETSIKYLEKMGISTLTDQDKTLALALGGQEKGITPLEMAAAYATIANDGVYIEPIFYTKVVNKDGKTVVKAKQKKKKVFSKEVAYILKELLKEPVEGSNGTAKPCRIEGMDVAAKTGTTNDNYDKWLCGFTTYYTAVTWYGYDTSETIAYRGKSPAVLLWSAVMKNVHTGLSGTTFSKPGGVKQAEICSETGNIASSKCKNTHTEYFLSGTLPGNCVGCTGTGTNTKTTQYNNNNNNNYEEPKQEVNNSTSNSVEVTNVPQVPEKTNQTNNTSKAENTNTNQSNSTQGASTNSSNSGQNTANSSGNQASTTSEAESNTNTSQNQTNNSGNNSTSSSSTETSVDDDEEDDGP